VQSELYETTDQKPLGVKIKIETWASKLGQISPKDLIVPGLTYLFVLVSKFAGQAYKQKGWPKSFFSELSSYSDPALIAWIVAFVWAMIVVISRFSQRHIEVKFDV